MESEVVALKYIPHLKMHMESTASECIRWARRHVQNFISFYGWWTANIAYYSAPIQSDQMFE